MTELIRVDQDWVPNCGEGSLYLRPMLIGTEPTFQHLPSETAILYCITCPAPAKRAHITGANDCYQNRAAGKEAYFLTDLEYYCNCIEASTSMLTPSGRERGQVVLGNTNWGACMLQLCNQTRLRPAITVNK